MILMTKNLALVLTLLGGLVAGTTTPALAQNPQFANDLDRETK
jgi:hypothetical protein